ncbi:MAG: tetratricopeptide repeat protein [Planctomycetes bacterium]|nr:tetratricopeptide repeat protein [Planctomycetota bacterium]
MRDAQYQPVNIADRGPHRATAAGRLAVAVLAAAWMSPVLADEPGGNAGGPDATTRMMAFVEKSTQATELFNERKAAEALPVFEELARDYADLDEDGYAIMGLADCLHALGRVDEARAQYEVIARAYPSLGADVRQRLREMALAGEPDDSLLNELRTEAATATEDVFTVQLQLGRALEKRAAALLREAVTAFRTAADTDRDLLHPARRAAHRQADMLAEIQEDVSSLIDRMEQAWGAIKTMGDLARCKDEQTDASVEGYQAAWTAPGKDQQRVRLEVTWTGDKTIKATMNGSPVQLSPTQTLLIRRHQERISAILLEAAQTGGAEPLKR